MLTKNSSAGTTHVTSTMMMTRFLVRHARYLAAILTEQNRSMVMSRTVNCDTRQTDGAQVPVAHQHVHSVEGHGYRADEDVCDSQRRQKIVGGLTNGPFAEEGHKHQDVAHDGDGNAQAQTHPDEYG
ncbi:hypothetical protein E2C01_030828 [Portunus trituberculatus]|uniref:Uncharacterized protein n=1 Tax=Portunus trituberculatus TaxID=210409 RepID=A0A5B7EV89_PORTR|nr:hypothetical protein [Portunus trituberculatus]